jgi:phage tail-like protein
MMVANAASTLLANAHGAFRFTVVIEGVPYGAFTEFTLPSLQVETQEIKEGGQNAYVHKLPVRVTVGSATLRHGISRDLTLLRWYLQVLNGDMQNATRQVAVVMYDSLHIPVAIWNFRNAYPVKWSGPTLKADNNSVAIEELEFVHHGFEVG